MIGRYAELLIVSLFDTFVSENSGIAQVMFREAYF